MIILPLEIAHHAAASTDFVTTLLHSNLLNVLLAVVILGWVLSKLNIGQALKNRQSALAASVQEMEQQKQHTQQSLHQLKHRSEQLHREIDQILSEARQSADTMSRQIIVQAEKEAERIRQQAIQQQKQLLLQAEESIQQTFMKDVLDEAETELRNQAMHVDPHHAINTFIDRLPSVAQRVSR